MKTFKMTIVRDRAKDWQEDIREITDGLRSRGLYPQGWTRDENFFHIGGTVNCDCNDKFDKAYCDEECHCSS